MAVLWGGHYFVRANSLTTVMKSVLFLGGGDNQAAATPIPIAPILVENHNTIPELAVHTLFVYRHMAYQSVVDVCHTCNSHKRSSVFFLDR